MKPATHHPPKSQTPHLAPLPLIHPQTLSAATFNSKTSLSLYDPGLRHTLAFKSSLTLINPTEGTLLHRGHSISSLARNASYYQLIFLLFYGGLPNSAQLRRFHIALYQPRFSALGKQVERVVTAFGNDCHPMSVLMAGVCALGGENGHLNPAEVGLNVYQNQMLRERAMLKAIGGFMGIAAGVYRHLNGLKPAFLKVDSRVEMGAGERFLRLCFGEGKVEKWMAEGMERLFVVHAEHEMNCSTMTVRGMSSSGVDVFTCLVGGIGALYGGLHGGAAEGVAKMLERVLKVGVRVFLEGVKNGNGKLMGFGHRVYRNYDPRARVIKEIVDGIRNRGGLTGKMGRLLKVAEQLEKCALGDQYFVSRKLFPNCDFYSGIVYGALGFDKKFFGVLFAVGRVGGWVAHWKEFLEDEDRKIFRPGQVYVGIEEEREVKRIEDREGWMGEGVSDDAVGMENGIARL